MAFQWEDCARPSDVLSCIRRSDLLPRQLLAAANAWNSLGTTRICQQRIPLGVSFVNLKFSFFGQAVVQLVCPGLLESRCYCSGGPKKCVEGECDKRGDF